jgi:hypothetical protein
MEIEVSQDTLSRIWLQLNMPHRPGRRDNMRTAHLDVLSSGWAAPSDIQDILYETDDRADVLARHNDDFSFLLEAYGLQYESRFQRPPAKVGEVWGHKAMRATDVAMFVMEIERLGFSVDAEPLVNALRPQLKALKFFTNSELSIWWYNKQRHHCEPIVLRSDDSLPDRHVTIVTHTGYRATSLLIKDCPIILRVDAPKLRSGFPIKYWLHAELNRISA